MIRAAPRIAALSALTLWLAGASASAAPPNTAVAELGGAREYTRSDPAATLALVQLVVRAGPVRQSAEQNGLAALVAQAIVSTPVDGVAVIDAVEARGGELRFDVSTQTVRFSLEAPPDALPQLVPLLARALASPSFDAATLTAARAALAERIAGDDADPRSIGLSMVRASYYRDGARLPPFGTPSSLSALGPTDARAFFARWYVRGGAFVSAVGRTGPLTDAASRLLVAALPAGTTPPAGLAVRPYAAQPKRIVTQRDLVAPFVVLGFAAPPLGDHDFAAALVVQSLLGDVFERAGATTVPPPFRATGTIYGYDDAPAQFAVWLNGARIDPSTGLAALDGVLSAAAAKPLAPAVLARGKQRARGEWALRSVSLHERAEAIGSAVVLGLDPDAADGVRVAIDAVSAGDVQRVVKKYFRRYDVALVVPRAGG